MEIKNLDYLVSIWIKWINMMIQQHIIIYSDGTLSHKRMPTEQNYTYWALGEPICTNIVNIYLYGVRV